jgi:hypothetical protein
MKKTLLAALLLLPVLPLSGSGPAFAETIPAQDAPAYFGRSVSERAVTVVGQAHVQRMASGEIFLDLEGKGDGAPVSAYVSRWNAAPFWDIARLDGKLVAVRGEIGSFRYRPEIFLTDPGQIAVVEPRAKAEASPQPLWIHIPPRAK